MLLIADLHTHTYASGHAYSTLKENIEQAKIMGLKYLGVSDHTPMMKGATDLLYFQNLRVLRKEIMGMRLLKGAEANIMNDCGELDLPYETASGLDYIIASLHPGVIEDMGIDRNTSAVIGAMTKRNVKIIGHPDDSAMPIHYAPVVAAAKAVGVALEVNNSSLSPFTGRKNTLNNITELLKLCKEYGTSIIIGSDSHVFYDIGNFKNAAYLLEELNFPEELIINADETRFLNFLNDEISYITVPASV